MDIYVFKHGPLVTLIKVLITLLSKSRRQFILTARDNLDDNKFGKCGMNLHTGQSVSLPHIASPNDSRNGRMRGKTASSMKAALESVVNRVHQSEHLKCNPTRAETHGILCRECP